MSSKKTRPSKKIESSEKTGYENCIVYMISNLVNDDTYVGSSKQTKKARFKQHMQQSYIHPRRRLYKSFIEVGRENVNMDILEKLSCKNEYELAARENYWTHKYKPVLNTCKINKATIDEDTLETIIHSEYITKGKKKEKYKEDPEVAKVRKDIKNMTSEEKTQHFDKLRDELFNQLNNAKSKKNILNKKELDSDADCKKIQKNSKNNAEDSDFDTDCKKIQKNSKNNIENTDSNESSEENSDETESDETESD